MRKTVRSSRLIFSTPWGNPRDQISSFQKSAAGYSLISDLRGMGFVVLPAGIVEDEDVGEQDMVLEDAAGEAALDVAPAPDDADRAEYLATDVMAGEFFELGAARLPAVPGPGTGPFSEVRDAIGLMIFSLRADIRNRGLIPEVHDLLDSLPVPEGKF